MRCDHHPTCPGCPLLDLDADQQLRRKQARLQRALDAYPHLQLGDVGDVLPAAHTEGYRHRLKLPIHAGQNRVSMGLIDPVSKRVVHTPDCPVLAPALREAIPPLLKTLHRQPGIRSVDLRVSEKTGNIQLVLATEHGALPGNGDLAGQLQQAIPNLTSLAVSIADPKRRRILGRDPQRVAGTDRIVEQIGETELHIFPGAFFQADPRTADQLHDLVHEAVGDASSVLDLYAGVGAYARMLAPGRQRIVAIEEIPAAAEAALVGAPGNLEVICGRAEDQDLQGLGPFDAAVINPARRGSRPEVLMALAQAVERIVYVSCSPETLARDLDILAFHGMRVTAIRPLDLFPQTAEVEAVVTLERGPALREWSLPRGGAARSPWGEKASGAVGRPTRILALVIGDTGEHVRLRDGSRARQLGTVAGHSLMRIDLQGRMVPALAELARAGHPLAGRHKTTDRFFAEKAGLHRSFLHIERTADATAPLHGDLVIALRQLGASDRLVARAGAPQ